MSLTWTGDRGRGHPNSPIQAELQVGLAWGNPGIALTTAPRPAMRQGPRPCLCLWVPTGSQIPHCPLGTTQGSHLWCLAWCLPTVHLFSTCPAQGATWAGVRVSEEHSRLGHLLPHHLMGPSPHLSLRHCQLVLGFASSSSLRLLFFLPLAVETLGVRSVMDRWLQKNVASGPAGPP